MVKSICCISWLRLDKKRRLYTALCHCKRYWLKQTLEMESTALTQSRQKASLIYPDENIYQIERHQQEITTRRHTALESGQAGPWDKNLRTGWRMLLHICPTYLQICTFSVSMFFTLCQFCKWRIFLKTWSIFRMPFFVQVMLVLWQDVHTAGFFFFFTFSREQTLPSFCAGGMPERCPACTTSSFKTWDTLFLSPVNQTDATLQCVKKHK